MNDYSTFMWMIQGGPRYDEHTQDSRQLEHMRALRESRAQAHGDPFGVTLTRLAGFLGLRTAHTEPTLIADRCVAAC